MYKQRSHRKFVIKLPAMKYIIPVCLFIACTTQVCAQPKQEQDAIKSLCGCYEVDFRYAETFAPDTAYKFHPRYHTGGLEWVVAEESGEHKMILQHLLVADDDFVIKHWREDWEFEQNNQWQFVHDAHWKKVNLDKVAVTGQWTQTVWEVDDAPRYQGSSRWIAVNGQHYWENTTDAPLPRREYTKRNDYNVMQRTNRVLITNTGWVHEQDNKKIIRTDGRGDQLLAEEKGYNIYTKVADSKCSAATAWWEKHRQFWITVRSTWDEILSNRSDIVLVSKVNGLLLYEQLDDLEKLSLTNDQLKIKVKAMLEEHIKQ